MGCRGQGLAELPVVKFRVWKAEVRVMRVVRVETRVFV